MTKFHINDRGQAGQCRAKVNCPFGGDEVHFSTADDARKAYELKMKDDVWPSPVGLKQTDWQRRHAESLRESLPDALEPFFQEVEGSGKIKVGSTNGTMFRVELTRQYTNLRTASGRKSKKKTWVTGISIHRPVTPEEGLEMGKDHRGRTIGLGLPYALTTEEAVECIIDGIRPQMGNTKDLNHNKYVAKVTNYDTPDLEL